MSGCVPIRPNDTAMASAAPSPWFRRHLMFSSRQVNTVSVQWKDCTHSPVSCSWASPVLLLQPCIVLVAFHCQCCQVVSIKTIHGQLFNASPLTLGLQFQSDMKQTDDRHVACKKSSYRVPIVSIGYCAYNLGRIPQTERNLAIPISSVSAVSRPDHTGVVCTGEVWPEPTCGLDTRPS